MNRDFNKAVKVVFLLKKEIAVYAAILIKHAKSDVLL